MISIVMKELNPLPNMSSNLGGSYLSVVGILFEGALKSQWDDFLKLNKMGSTPGKQRKSLHYCLQGKTQ